MFWPFLNCLYKELILLYKYVVTLIGCNWDNILRKLVLAEKHQLQDWNLDVSWLPQEDIIYSIYSVLLCHQESCCEQKAPKLSISTFMDLDTLNFCKVYCVLSTQSAGLSYFIYSRRMSKKKSKVMFRSRLIFFFCLCFDLLLDFC